MKKILYSVFSAVALLSIAACSNNDDELDGGLNMGGTPNPNVPTTIIASTESSTTRAALQGDDENGYNVVWSADDKITLQGSENPTMYPSVDYVLEEGAGTTQGKFAPVSDALNWSQCTEVKATYGVKDNEWPANQTYCGGDVISNAPMYCSVKNQHTVPTLSFKNMGGMLRLKLKGIRAIKRIEITAPNDPISGTIAQITDQGTAKIDANGGHTITLQMSENVQLTPEGKVFNIAMPSSYFSTNGGYANVAIKVVDKDDNEIVKTMKEGTNLVINRSKITNVSITIDAVTGTAKRDDNIDVKWVQLWAGGPKFAEYNVGASAVDGDNSRGDLYNFKHTDNSSNTYYSIIDYATKAWGNNWRMPTKDEFDALLANCDYEWVNGTGKDGCLFTGKGAYSANSIYLPAVNDASGLGYAGSYWSSTEATTIYSTPKAYSLSIHYTEGNKVTSREQNNKFSVRAVLKEN